MPNGKQAQRLIRFQPGRRPIPGGITPKDFLEITEKLTSILEDIDEALIKAGAKKTQRPKEVHIRLNETDKTFPLPIFAGWVEAAEVRKTREEWNHPHPGLHRFGDDVYSEIYGEAFCFANHKDRSQHFRYRDWDNSKIPELLEKRSGEKATDPKAGNRFQTCLAIVVRVRGQLCCVGTLVVGFRSKLPDPLLRKAQNVLREWARGPATKSRRKSLINFLKRFELGGPRLRNSNWQALIP